MTNDLPRSDKGRTAASELGYGKYSIGFNVYTSEGNDITTTKGKAWESPIWGYSSNGSYDRGDVYSSALYFGYRTRGIAYRTGIDAPFVQDFFQNGVHRHISGSPYFQKGNYLRVYGYRGTYNRFIY
jgi:hypothetical protein